MADLNAILTDPDFLASSADTKREILSAHDADFAASAPETQSQILAKWSTAPAAQENPLASAYRQYVADPLTKAVASAPKYMMGDLDVRNPDAGRIREEPMFSEATARALVPQTPAGGAAALVSAPFGGTYLKAILAPLLASGAASLASGNTPAEAGKDALMYGAAGGAGKALGDLGAWLYRGLPYVKDRIMEGNARGLAGVAASIDPNVGRAIADQDVSPLLKGGTTMAKLRQAATGGDLRTAASRTMQGAIDEINVLSGHPTYPLQGALKDAWNEVPDLIKSQIIGAVKPGPMSASVVNPWGPEQISQSLGPDMLTLEQAQAVRSYLGGKAFSQMAKDRGLDEAAVQLLRGKVTNTIEERLAPDAVPLWRSANQQYGGTSVIDEFANMRNAKTGLPNRMFPNRNALSDFLDENREDLIKRMGKDQFDAIVQQALSGAQPGTRDILTSGAGTPLSALLQAGRGTNTGSIQAIGVPARTFVPGLGNEWTGRPVGQDASVMALLRMISPRVAEQFRQAQRGEPVKIGPVP